MIAANPINVSAEVLADARLIAECVERGMPIPSEVRQRVRNEAKRITQAVFEKHGILDIAVPAIREIRNAE